MEELLIKLLQEQYDNIEDPEDYSYHQGWRDALVLVANELGDLADDIYTALDKTGDTDE